ncbi:alpha/beta fold hydrolase [Nocardia sp. NPDC057455]|uniref:alpha/beta fold hydrolase n=1 Tax=Nocardia sp. NPDC057455 TaxID=3346138 RepID=UPI00366F0BF5
MKLSTHHRRGRRAMVIAGVAATLALVPATSDAVAPTGSAPASGGTDKPTIVLVHGAWADASSFAPVTALLQSHGYTVFSAPNPLRGLGADAASVAAFVDQATTGPVVLVGHSYGGAVITNAARSVPRVAGLVYIDAFAPAADETVVQLTGAHPGSVLAADPATVFDVVQDPSLPQGDPNLYVKRTLFPAAFAARLPRAVGATLAAAQSPIAAGALNEPSGAPAWATIRSWFFIGADDRVIPAAEQEAMAARAGSVTVTGKTDHLAMLEAPDAVTALIERAASGK